MTLEKKYTQVGDEVREYTADEYAQWELDTQAALAAQAAEDAIKAQEALDRARGEAKLLAVGLTKDEIEAIRKE